MNRSAMRGFAMAVLTACAPIALACRFEHFDLRENISAADAAFVATVISDSAPRGRAGALPVARLRVDAVLKGKRSDAEVEVESRFGTCGVELNKGERWIIVARSERGRLWTSQPLGSLQLTDTRGLQQRAAWDALRRAARPGQLDGWARDACVAARFALLDFFDRLPHSCKTDADCVADQYIDTQACYPPVVTNRERVPLGQVEALLDLQRRERQACPLDSARIPACGPITVPVTCVASVCAARR
jgi:hypothetical protein